MYNFKHILLSLMLCGSSLSSMAQPAPSAAVPPKNLEVNGGPNPERGWFFFEDPAKKEESPKKDQQEPAPLKREIPPPPEERCKKKDTWDAECGFVDPGEDFSFQAKQRDALLEKMVVSKNNPKAVEAFQYYTRWMLDRASEVTNYWWYNMVQNPDLDPSVRAPVSAFGLKLMANVKEANAESIYKILRDDGALFVYFSRSDCSFCTQMAEPLRKLAKDTGVPLKMLSLDSKCIPVRDVVTECLTAPDSIPPAQALKVSVVPSLFLYIRPNTWLRIATGLTDTETIQIRTIQFFSAYRSALLKGVQNNSSDSSRPNVDFSGIDPTGTKDGVKVAPPPSEDQIKKMLGAN